MLLCLKPFALFVLVVNYYVVFNIIDLNHVLGSMMVITKPTNWVYFMPQCVPIGSNPWLERRAECINSGLHGVHTLSTLPLPLAVRPLGGEIL